MDMRELVRIRDGEHGDENSRTALVDLIVDRMRLTPYGAVLAEHMHRITVEDANVESNQIWVRGTAQYIDQRIDRDLALDDGEYEFVDFSVNGGEMVVVGRDTNVYSAFGVIVTGDVYEVIAEINRSVPSHKPLPDIVADIAARLLGIVCGAAIPEEEYWKLTSKDHYTNI